MTTVTLKVPDNLFDIAERAKANNYAQPTRVLNEQAQLADIIRLGRWLMNHLKLPPGQRCPFCHRKLTGAGCPALPCIERIKRLKEETPERASCPEDSPLPIRNPGQTAA